jgi:hypothetical protein
MTPISNTQRPSYAKLARENSELKARVADLESKNGPISVNPEQGTLEVQDLRIGPLSVESARVRAPALRKATRDMEKIETWLDGGKDSLKEFADGPVVIDRLKAEIPLPFVNSLMEKIAGDQMSRAGLSNVSLSQGEGTSLRVQGQVKKGIKLPFEVNGSLAATKDGKVKFSLQSSRLGGLPMPNFLVSMASKFADDGLRKAGITVEGQDFTFDPKRLKPENVLFKMDSLAVHDGAILVDGSAPSVRGKSNIPQIPRKRSRS